MKRYLSSVALLAGLASVLCGPAFAGVSPLLRSRHLWATVDVCNTPKHPNVIGIRGSMPGDGRKTDQLYMRFRLQYQVSAGGAWAYANGADSGFLLVGSAEAKARQAGRNFTITPIAGGYVMRGVVAFEWRRGKKVLLHADRITTAGHLSLAGADPARYSAAACSLP